MSMDRRKMIALGAGGAVFATTSGTATADPHHEPHRTGGGRKAEIPTDAELARSLSGDFSSRYALVNGVRLHYVTGGEGDPLILLPGWPQTWWCYRKVMPALAEHYRVIAVDLRGMGGSDKPQGGYDKKTMAADIHGLVRSLGHSTANIVGHDMGAKVAYSYAVNHAEATRKVALLDILHPDETFYDVPMLQRPGAGFNLWWWAFNQVQGLPEQLVVGRARHIVDWFYANTLRDQSWASELDREVHARPYNTAEGVRAANSWYQAWHQDIQDMKTYGKVTVPLLGLSSETSDHIFQQLLPGQAADARIVKLDGTIHYLPEEAPERVTEELLKFFA